MASAVIELTDQEERALRSLAAKTGRQPEELLHEAVARFLAPVDEERLSRLRQARGLWKDRSDLPQLDTLRAEFDRSSGTNE